jgi:putative CocE/NonD family hydrolase
MTDSSRNSGAWSTTPHDYLATRQDSYSDERLRRSCYLTMRDGVRIATDIFVPAEAGWETPLPTIAVFTPYYRRFKLTSQATAETEESPNAGYIRDFFTQHGYAVVVVDVRGSGASFGTRDGFRSPKERLDYAEIADWIVVQPWSNGSIGSTGISYVGAAADFLATTGHPAVKAVIPTFAVWDTFADHYNPNGLHVSFLGPEYNALMEALDIADPEKLKNYSYFADPVYAGPAPVDEDPDGVLLAQASAEHAANVDMTQFIREFAYRDDGLSYDPDYTAPMIGPAYYADTINPDVAYYSVSGWMDAVYFANAATRRFLSLPVERKHLLLGPWDHGARTNVSPFRTAELPEFEKMGAYLRFFDQYLKGEEVGFGEEAPVHYFTMVEEQWKAAASWPPPEAEPHRYYFADGAKLSRQSPDIASASDTYSADFSIGTGAQTRYERAAAIGVEAYYADWHGRDAGMLTYTSAPLSGDTEVTGHPIITLYVASSEKDGAFCVYLEDVAPDGQCRYVTEGVLRALHRRTSEAPWNLKSVGPYRSLSQSDAELLTPGEVTELCFDLVPTSWLFRKGHSIRIAVSAADRDHFSRIPGGRPPELTFYREAARASAIELPVIPHGS